MENLGKPLLKKRLMKLIFDAQRGKKKIFDEKRNLKRKVTGKRIIK